MTRDFHPIEFEATQHGPSRSKEYYDFLSSEILDSKHGSRFELRELNIEATNGTPSPQNVDLPYIAPVETDNEHRLWVAKLASGLVMPRADWEALRTGFAAVYEHPEVKEHLAGGGVLKFVDSHRTYTGQVIQKIASWTVLNESGVDSPHEIQTTIASRITSLFRLSLLEAMCEADQIKHHGGAIIEDVLLPFGGVLLTTPNSNSGNRLVQAIHGGLEARREVVARTKLAYEQLVNRGGSNGQIFFEGSSGSENEFDVEKNIRIIGEVKDRTIELTTDYNQTEDAERVMAVPIFMESDPYTKDPRNPISPKPTPFAILEPRFPKTRRDFDEMMTEIAAAGNIVKKSGEVPYKYEKFLVGRRRHTNPDIIFKHTA